MKFLVKCFQLITGGLAAVVIRLVRPIRHYRIGCLPSHEIGHYAANVEAYLCERDAGVGGHSKESIDIWYRNPSACVSNTQLDKMWKRTIRISNSPMTKYIDAVSRRLPGGSTYTIQHHDRDAYALSNKSEPHLKFIETEEVDGQNFLRSIQTYPEQKFICLAVRDSSYKREQFASRDNDKDNYRNNDISNYETVARNLADSGYLVIRMGAKVERPFVVDHLNVIDYATNGMRSEFLDIYLGAKCEMFVSTALGIDEIAKVFRRPRVFTNYLPIGNFGKCGPGDLIIPKQYWLNSESRFLTFSEIVSFNFNLASCTSSYEYQLAGITLVENTPTEILEATRERLSRIAGTWTTTAENEARRVGFWSFYYRLSPPAIRSNVERQEPIIGSAFLRDNPHWTI